MKKQPFINVNLQVMENSDHVLTMYAEAAIDPTCEFDADDEIAISHAARMIEYMFKRYNEFHISVCTRIDAVKAG